jgi:hypothetical protein
VEDLVAVEERDALSDLVRDVARQQHRHGRPSVEDEVVERAAQALDHHHEAALAEARPEELADARVAHAGQDRRLLQQILALGRVVHHLDRDGHAQPPPLEAVPAGTAGRTNKCRE